jgi:outer membrane protein assembly factor BamB
MSTIKALALALAITIAGCTMSETGGDRPDVDSLYWATDPGGFGRTEPGGSHKLAGYDPGNPPATPGEVPDALNHNWLFGFAADVVRWLDATHVREFEFLREAITATSTPEVFRIGQPAGGQHEPGDDVFAAFTPAAITGTINEAVTDGERIYLLDSNRNLVAINPEDGATLWSVVIQTTVDFGALATTGSYLYLSGIGATPGLVEVDPTTGLEAQRAGALNAAVLIVANGDHAAAIDGAAANVIVYSGLGGTLVEDGTIAMGGNYQAIDLAMDRKHLYVIAYDVVATTSQIRAYDNTTRALLWAYSTPSSPAAGNFSNSLDTDGEFIYVANKVATHSVSGNQYNAFVLDRSGNEVSHTRVGGLNDLHNVTTDGRIVFFEDVDTGDAIATAASGQSLGYLWNQGDMVPTECDGVASIGIDSSNQIARRRSADQPVMFQRVNGSDPARRPFHNLAIPIWR